MATDLVVDVRDLRMRYGRKDVLSGLKTLLETGEPLTTPGSLRYSAA